MTRPSIGRRLAAIVVTLAAAILAFAAGLFLMNVRSDLAFVAGAFLCVAAAVIAGVRIWTMLEEDAR